MTSSQETDFGNVAEAAVVMVDHWPVGDKQRVAIHYSVLGSSVVLQV